MCVRVKGVVEKILQFIEAARRVEHRFEQRQLVHSRENDLAVFVRFILDDCFVKPEILFKTVVENEQAL